LTKGLSILSNVSLEIFPGEVHGLIGSNGAGKSTLIKILSGDINPDSGNIYFEGHPLEIHNPQEAYKLGFSFIHQELNLVPKFSILKNLTLGMKKPTRFGFINWKAVRNSVENVVEKVALNQPLDTLVENLSVADQWLVTIAHALMRNIKIISMDEPTASLSAEESDRLFKVIEDLTADGISVLYVSHRLDEVLTLCDAISVFKDGKCVLTTNRQKATKKDLVNAIVGSEVNEVMQLRSKNIENNKEVLRLQSKRQNNHTPTMSVAILAQVGERSKNCY
jgi:ABC-type sugar transport system ATPase subunit